MKKNLKPIIAGLLFSSAAAFALNPMPGTYAGIVAGASYIPKLNFEFNNPLTPYTTKQSTGVLAYDLMGNIGGQLGYRFCDNYRIEGEFTYNFVPYAYLKLGEVTFHSPDSSAGIRLRGTKDAGIGLINLYYDAFGDFSSNVVPYVGIGGGYAYMYNFIEFFYNDVYISGTRKSAYTGRVAGQAIIGISYYLDDFSAFSLDGRYLSTLAGQVTTSRNQVISSSMQTYSFNIVFNGAFELG